MRPGLDSSVPFLGISGKSQSQRMVMPDGSSMIIFPFLSLERWGGSKKSQHRLKVPDRGGVRTRIRNKVSQQIHFPSLPPSLLNFSGPQFASPVKWRPVTYASQDYCEDLVQSWIEKGTKIVKMLSPRIWV